MGLQSSAAGLRFTPPTLTFKYPIMRLADYLTGRLSAGTNRCRQAGGCRGRCVQPVADAAEPSRYRRGVPLSGGVVAGRLWGAAARRRGCHSRAASIDGHRGLHDPGTPERPTRQGGYLDQIDTFDPRSSAFSRGSEHGSQPAVPRGVLGSARACRYPTLACSAFSVRGIGQDDYAQPAAIHAVTGIDHYDGTGNLYCFAPGALYCPGSAGRTWRSTACSSSLMAVQLAVQSLRNRDCDLARGRRGAPRDCSWRVTLFLSQARVHHLTAGARPSIRGPTGSAAERVRHGRVNGFPTPWLAAIVCWRSFAARRSITTAAAASSQFAARRLRPT